MCVSQRNVIPVKLIGRHQTLICEVKQKNELMPISIVKNKH